MYIVTDYSDGQNWTPQSFATKKEARKWMEELAVYKSSTSTSKDPTPRYVNKDFVIIPDLICGDTILQIFEVEAK